MLWLAPSALIALLVAIPPLLAWTRILPPETAFIPFFFGLAIALISVPILAGAGAFASATGREWRGRAVTAAILPFLAVAVFVLPNTGHPPIHDATTDAQDTLDFSTAVPERAEGSPREEVLQQQREKCPDLAPLMLPLDAPAAFARALDVARGFEGWTVQRSDEATGLIEATVESGIFRFVDDVVIRLQPEASGVRIDMRSRSRFGQSDLGANAARIRAYFEKMKQATRTP